MNLDMVTFLEVRIATYGVASVQLTLKRLLSNPQVMGPERTLALASMRYVNARARASRHGWVPYGWHPEGIVLLQKKQIPPVYGTRLLVLSPEGRVKSALYEKEREELIHD